MTEKVSENKIELTKEEMEKNKETIKSLLISSRRPGIENLIGWMENKTDFFTAPASGKYHLCCKGGLAQHSLNVYSLLKKKTEDKLLDIAVDTVTITSLLHDLCKVNFYVTEKRNVKEGNKLNAYGKEVANWVEKEVWGIQDSFPVGHGERSCYYIQRFIQISKEEYAMIRLHMGPEKGSYPDPFSQSASIFPSVAAIYSADLEAAFIVEARGQE